MNEDISNIYNRAIDWLIVTGPKVLVGIIMSFVGLWIIKLLKKKFRQLAIRKNINPTLRIFIENLIFTILYILLFLLVLQIVGIQLTLFAAVVAAFGAAAGLALSGTLQNFASGVLILLLKPFKVGDNIIGQGIEGKVESIQIFYTVVKTFDNRSVILPNSKLSNEVITNITRDGIRRLDIVIEFSMLIPVDSITSVLEQAFARSKEVLESPKVRIGITEFTTEKYKLTSNIWVSAHGFEDTRRVVNEYIIAALKEHNIIGVND